MTTDKVLEIVIKAKDEASGTLNKVSGAIQNNSKKILAFGTVITGALGLAVKSAADAQVAMGKVDAVLTTMGKNTSVVKGKIQDLANATMKLGFDNEDTALSITKLYQVTGDLTKANEMNNLAMDLARFKNISLEQATTAVTKALTGNTRIMSDLGIEIDDTLTPMENLRKVQKRVAGQADQFSKSFQGQMEALNQQMGEFKESVGTALLPVLTSLLAVITPVVEKMNTWSTTNPDLFNSIVTITGALGLLLVAMGLIGFAIPPIVAGFAAIGIASTAILPVIGIIGFLALAMTNVSKITKLLLTDSQLVFDGLKIYWQEFMAVIGEIFLGLKIIWDDLVIYINEKVVEPIKVAFTGMWDSITETFKGAIDGIKNMFEGLKEHIKQFAEDVKGGFDIVKEGTKNAIKKVKDKVTGKAVGGGVHSGTSYVVGERGPEMFTPSSNGSITPNHALSGQGGQTVVINMNGGTYLDKNVAEEIGDMIIQNFKKIARI